MQWYCRLAIKNSVLDLNKFAVGLIDMGNRNKPKIVNKSLIHEVECIKYCAFAVILHRMFSK